MVDHYTLSLQPRPRGFHLITSEVLDKLGPLPETGLFHLYICHTSAGLSINEDADPSVRVDFASAFDRLVQEDEPWYTHTVEGSDDMPAHIKSVLTGHAVSVPIINAKLALGTWQGIYLCEFRNRASARTVIATIYR